MEQLPSAQDWLDFALQNEPKRDFEQERAMWNAKAPSYAHKRTRSGYLEQLLKLLELEPGDSVFDMGCGPGVLSIPLAQAGHNVVAVDFSQGMLAELESAVVEAGMQERVQVFQRAWQESWDDLPGADVALSSRSMTTKNYADAVAKLESKARKRVVVTTGAGETPWTDLALLKALGRSLEVSDLAADFIAFLNWLIASGRNPEVRYITTERRSHSEDAEELRSFLHKSADVKPEEEDTFAAFIAQHMRSTADGGVEMDYTQDNRWAVISWTVAGI